MMFFTAYLRAQPLYTQLPLSYQTLEGNLLERADERTTEAQLEAHRWALHLSRPDCILETGTNKSLFAFFLSQMLHHATLYTFDADPRSATGVELVNTAQTRVHAVFTLGDTKQTLADFHTDGIGFAWIDGGHDEPTCRSDIHRAMQLGIPLIAVDDAKAMPQVAKAIDDATGAYPRYARLSNPFFEHDARGIVFVRDTDRQLPL